MYTSLCFTPRRYPLLHGPSALFVSVPLSVCLPSFYRSPSFVTYQLAVLICLIIAFHTSTHAIMLANSLRLSVFSRALCGRGIIWSMSCQCHPTAEQRVRGERKGRRSRVLPSHKLLNKPEFFFFFFLFWSLRVVFFIHPTTKKIVFLPQEVVSIVHVTRFSSTSCLAANRP